MDESKSQFLHFLRWVAALAVVLGHARLIGGPHPDNAFFTFVSSHSHAAVMLFFVLSGYVIAATTEKKQDKGYALRDYYLDRFSRIYSVLLAAIAFTLVLDALGAKMFPMRYGDAALVPQNHLVIRFLVNLFSVQGIWGYRVQFGSNPPLWSIGYEVCYYILFGLIIWRPKGWPFFLALICTIMGPWVVLYGLLWGMGVLAFKLKRKLPTLVGLAVFLVANHYLQYDPVPIPALARDLLFGLAALMFVMTSPAIPAFLFPFNREMAEFSYSLYAFHFPVMFFAFSFAPSSSLYLNWGLVVIALASSRALYYVSERQRPRLRAFAASLFRNERIASSVQSPLSEVRERER